LRRAIQEPFQRVGGLHIKIGEFLGVAWESERSRLRQILRGSALGSVIAANGTNAAYERLNEPEGLFQARQQGVVYAVALT
jgi:hypothetical protein